MPTRRFLRSLEGCEWALGLEGLWFLSATYWRLSSGSLLPHRHQSSRGNLQMAFQRENRGCYYQDYVLYVLERKSARTYLEVGVRDGALLAKVRVPSIGVDPSFMLDRNVMAYKRKVFLFQMTSDEFFRDYDPRQLFDNPVDVAFLDGLHQFEYLLRDFINTEAFCHRDSVIMLDDCLPTNAEMTERVFNREARIQRDVADWWTGDVWKIVSILERYRPDLHIIAADTQPTGNVSVTNLDPSSTVLRSRYYEILTEYVALESDDEALRRFYDKLAVRSTVEILSHFEASRFVGP